jgi:hypothetical protein
MGGGLTNDRGPCGFIRTGGGIFCAGFCIDGAAIIKGGGIELAEGESTGGNMGKSMSGI